MTNKEKSKLIAINYGGIRDSSAYMTRENCYDASMQMADWKDQEELKFLQTLCFQSNTGIVWEKIQNRINELEKAIQDDKEQ